MDSVRSSFSKLATRLEYLRKSIGLWGMFKRVFAQISGPIVDIDRCHIVVRYLQPELSPSEAPNAADEYGTLPLVATSIDDLEPARNDLDDYFELDRCRSFLQSGSNRFLVLARRPIAEDRYQIIAWYTCERGVFSIWDDLVRIDLPDNYAMVHDNEVHPDYRGQRVSNVTREGYHTYAQTVGLDHTVFAIRSHNAASLKSSKRSGETGPAQSKGEIRRVKMLGGLIVHATAPDTVRDMILAAEDA